MIDLTREDVARFLAVWKRAYVPTGLLTPQVLKVVEALEVLTVAGGIVMIDEPSPEQMATEPLTVVPAAADDIPF